MVAVTTKLQEPKTKHLHENAGSINIVVKTAEQNILKKKSQKQRVS